MRQALRSLLLLFALLPAGCGQRAPGTRLESFSGHEPRILWDTAGRLHAVYVENQAGGPPALAYRRLGKDAMGPVRITPPGLEVAASRETPATLDQLPDGTLVTGYPVTLPGKWQSELRVQRSTDGGKTWEEPRILHAPESGAHSFLSSATSTLGTVAFAWLDKTSGQMGLRAASTRDGRTFSRPETVDARTCQCCGTAMAAGPGGTLWLAFRDLEADDLRDFRVLRTASDPPVFQDGAKLSSDGWRIRGCPETGARLAEAPDGTLWAAWFTGGGEPGVYVSFSRDGGKSFVPRTLLTDPGQLGRHPEIGVLGDGRIAVLYETSEGDRHSIQARVRDDRGAWEKARTLAYEGTYPRLATHGQRTAVAFTCGYSPDPRVVVADWEELAGGDGSFCGKAGS